MRGLVIKFLATKILFSITFHLAREERWHQSLGRCGSNRSKRKTWLHRYHVDKLWSPSFPFFSLPLPIQFNFTAHLFPISSWLFVPRSNRPRSSFASYSFYSNRCLILPDTCSTRKFDRTSPLISLCSRTLIFHQVLIPSLFFPFFQRFLKWCRRWILWLYLSIMSSRNL